MIQAAENRFESNVIQPKTIEELTVNVICLTAAETRSFAKELGLKPKLTNTDSRVLNTKIFMSGFYIALVKL